MGSPVGQFPPNIPLSSLQRPISGRCMAAVGLFGRKEAKILAYRGMITLQQLDESEILPSRSWLLRGEPKRNMKEKKKQASKQQTDVGWPRRFFSSFGGCFFLR